MIEKVLDLSTAHAPSPNPDFGEARYVAHSFGWIVFVQGPQGNHQELDGVPAWLIPIMMKAQNEKCILINFDMDAEEIEGLSTWDW